MAAEALETIRRRLAFLFELDRLKSFAPRSPLIDRARWGNSAEHSWHLAIFALVLSEHAKLMLLHHIVEIDAADAAIHSARRDKAVLAREERAAAERIFGMLPPKQGQKFLLLCFEFEAGETSIALFAKALDRFQPLRLNTLTVGDTWAENGVSVQHVMERYGSAIEGGTAPLRQVASTLVRQHFGRHAKAQRRSEG